MDVTALVWYMLPPRGSLTGDNLLTCRNLRSDRAGVRSFASGRIPKRGGVGKLGGLEKCLRGLSARCGDSNCLACTELRHPGGFRLYKRC